MDSLWKTYARQSNGPELIEIRQPSKDLEAVTRRSELGAAGSDAHGKHENVCQLNTSYLQSKRILAYDGADQRSRPYDMLRTQVLQSMTVGGWRILGVTSPGPGCGKTLTATNLAFSIAQAKRSIGHFGRFGFSKTASRQLLSVLYPLTEAHSTCFRNGIRWQAQQFRCALAIEVFSFYRQLRRGNPLELIGSRAMRNLLQEFRRNYRSHIVILDLPPMLVERRCYCTSAADRLCDVGRGSRNLESHRNRGVQ